MIHALISFGIFDTQTLWKQSLPLSRNKSFIIDTYSTVQSGQETEPFCSILEIGAYMFQSTGKVVLTANGLMYRFGIEKR